MIFCPECGDVRSKVKVTRHILTATAGYIRRRRECLACGTRFSTVEALDPR